MAEWYEDDDDPQTEPRRGDGKGLRSQLEKALAEVAELKTKNSELSGNLRKATIAGFFRDKGLNPKVAKYVPSDIDPTEDNLKKWVEEDGELFNISLKPAEKAAEKPAEGSADQAGSEGAQDSAQANSDGSLQDAWRQIANAQSGTQAPGRESDLMTQITSATDLAALEKVIFSHGGGTEFM